MRTASWALQIELAIGGEFDAFIHVCIYGLPWRGGRAAFARLYDTRIRRE